MTAIQIWALAVSMLVAAFAGLVAGGVVNTLADHVVGVDEPVWNARQCRACLAPLHSASWFALREFVSPRRCPACGKRVSLRRPALQATLTLAFPALVAHAVLNPGHPSAIRATPMPAWALIVVGAVLLGALAFTFVVDLEHRLIYDLAIWPPMGLIALAALLFNRQAAPAIIVAGLIAGGLFLLFYGLGWLIYRQEALGLGDVKLAALVGVAAGWPGVITALGLTVGLGFGVALLLLAVDSKSRRSYIPFGVFLALGSAITLLATPFPW